MAKERDDEYKMTPTVYGVGYLGVGDYKARKESKGMTKEYVMWTNMLSRCYSHWYLNNPNNSQRYAECTVCEDWHNFQNFAKWCNEQPNFGEPRYSLDKDMTEFGNTVYCPEKCYIIAPKVNNCIKMLEWKKDTDLPRGVYRNHSQYQIRVNRVSTYYKDAESAGQAYKTQMQEQLKVVAEQFKHEITEAIYQNLLNWAP